MNKIILDTSVYIPMLRSGKGPGSVIDAVDSVIYLSAVVMQELYAGAVDGNTLDFLNDLCVTFQKNGRIITPCKEDWFAAGSILSRMGQKHGFETIKKGRLVNDVLIAISCGKIDAVLLTQNRKDFQRIQEFLKFDFISVQTHSYT